MNKSIVLGLAILTVSSSAALAWTHQSERHGYRTHHSSAYRAIRPAQREAMTSSAYSNGYYGPGYAASYGPGYAGSYGPGYVGSYGPGYAGYYGPGYAGYYGPGYARSGFWPADVAGAAVGTAGAIAAGAVNTAGAIATAPFRPANSYAYYPANSYAYRPANSYGMAPGAVSRKDHEMRMKNLRASGYDPKKDFTKAGTMAQQ
jgi:hypothetical protein